jgi:type IV pilus assembly protein PilV
MIRNALRGTEGFTLIEGMVGAAILGVALLTLSAMHGIAFSRNVDAHEMTRVTNILADIMERMQYNRRNIAAYNGIDTSVVCAQDPVQQPQARGDCLQWQALVQGSRLTAARGRITVGATGPTNPQLGMNNVTVSLVWNGDNAGGGTKVARQRTISQSAVIAPE